MNNQEWKWNSTDTVEEIAAMRALDADRHPGGGILGSGCRFAAALEGVLREASAPLPAGPATGELL